MNMYLGENKAIDFYIKQQIKNGSCIEVNDVCIDSDNVDDIDFSTLDGCKYQEDY